MENLGRLGFFVGILTFNPASDTTFPTNSSSLKPNEHLVALRNKLCFLKHPSTESKRDTNSLFVSAKTMQLSMYISHIMYIKPTNTTVAIIC